MFDAKYILSGSVLAVMFILAQKFLSPAFLSTNAALARVTKHHEEAALTCGASRWRIFRQIQLPAIKKGLLAAFLLVFVEVGKELPITLIARPFGFDTLAIKIYEMTSSDVLNQAGLPSFRFGVD